MNRHNDILINIDICGYSKRKEKKKDDLIICGYPHMQTKCKWEMKKMCRIKNFEEREY